MSQMKDNKPGGFLSFVASRQISGISSPRCAKVVVSIAEGARRRASAIRNQEI
jgi:hypothetical protein